MSLRPTGSGRRRNPGDSERQPHWQRWLMPSAHGFLPLIEIVVGMAAATLLLAFLSPEDPLLLRLGFPWLGVYALIFSLRYGALLGAVGGDSCCWTGGCSMARVASFRRTISPAPS